MSEHREQAETLLAAGLRDQLALRLLRQSGEAPHESMGFHAQQASEKFIKAVLVMHGIVFERTHDLAALAELCIAHHIEMPLRGDVLRQLNTYAVTFRYEGCPVAMVDMEDASRIVATLLAWAQQHIG